MRVEDTSVKSPISSVVLNFVVRNEVKHLTVYTTENDVKCVTLAELCSLLGILYQGQYTKLQTEPRIGLLRCQAKKVDGRQASMWCINILDLPRYFDTIDVWRLQPERQEFVRELQKEISETIRKTFKVFTPQDVGNFFSQLGYGEHTIEAEKPVDGAMLFRAPTQEIEFDVELDNFLRYMRLSEDTKTRVVMHVVHIKTHFGMTTSQILEMISARMHSIGTLAQHNAALTSVLEEICGLLN